MGVDADLSRPPCFDRGESLTAVRIERMIAFISHFPSAYPT
jgi:hypothetical protein